MFLKFPPTIIFFFLISAWHCQSIDNQRSLKEENAKQKGYFSFITIQLKQEIPSKQITLQLTLKNISELEEIKNVKILIFPYDKNGMILVPETKKTPELICEWKKNIQPNQIQSCEIPGANYNTEVERVKVHSLSLRLADGTSHLVNAEELGELIEWK